MGLYLMTWHNLIVKTKQSYSTCQQEHGVMNGTITKTASFKKIMEYVEGDQHKVKRITYKGDREIETEVSLDEEGSYPID